MGSKDSIVNIILNLIKQGSGAQDAKNDFGDLDKALGQVGNTIVGTVLGFTSLAGATAEVIEVVKESITAAADAQSTYVQMDATIQSTGRSSEISAPQIDAMAKSMEGLFTHVDIEQASTELMRYIDIPTQQIPGDLVVIENMAAGLGETLPAAADQFGMAMETGRTRGLGFSRELTNEISLMAQHGDIAQMDTLILGQLSQKFGGDATAALNTYNGTLAQSNTQWQDLTESVGGFLLGPGSLLTKIWDDNLRNLTLYVDQLHQSGQEIVQFFDGVFHVSQQTGASFSDQQQYLSSMQGGLQEADTATQQLSDDTADLTSQEGFLIDALKSITKNDQSIQDVEDKITAARKQGYTDSGAKIQGYESQINDLKTKEDTAMKQMVADWVYQNSVMGSKDPKVFDNFLDMEKNMGLIDQSELDSATHWLDYAADVSVPVTGTVTITHLDIYETEHLGEIEAAMNKKNAATATAVGMNTIVNSPTHILAGEAGPERVVITPLSGPRSEGAGGGTIVLSPTFQIYSLNPREITDQVMSQLQSMLALQGIRVKQ